MNTPKNGLEHCSPGGCTGCCGCSVVCTSHPCGERDPLVITYLESFDLSDASDRTGAPQENITGRWTVAATEQEDVRDTAYSLRTPGAIYRIDSDPVTGRFTGARTTPALEQIAESMIRMDMALADVRGFIGPWTSRVMQWAVATAGHLFGSHTLWDYDLVSNEDHVHRCFDHRHEGPLTRGFRL